MASEDDTPGHSNSSPAASPSQEVLATLPASAQSPTCPICQETITDKACVTWCRHDFCFACIMAETDVKTVCPVCQGSFQYVFHEVEVSEYEVHRAVPGSRRTLLSLNPIAEWRQSASSDTLQADSSGNEESSDQAGTSEQDESRTLMQAQSGTSEQDESDIMEQDESRAPEQQQQGGHSRDQQDLQYNTRRSRRQPQSRPPRPQTPAPGAQRHVPASSERVPRQQRHAPASSGRRERHQRGGRNPSRQGGAARSRSQPRSRSRSRSPARRRDW